MGVFLGGEVDLEAGAPQGAGEQIMKKMIRLIRHSLRGRWLVKKYFSKKDLLELAERIGKSENKHRAEIKIIIEASLNLTDVFKGKRAIDRAIDLFSMFRVWDTQENSGVLIYLMLTDHKLEILADRGIHKALGHDYWDKLNHKIIQNFKNKEYKKGIIYAIDQVTKEMVKLFPKKGKDPDEISNEVIIL